MLLGKQMGALQPNPHLDLNSLLHLPARVGLLSSSTLPYVFTRLIWILK